MSKLHEKYRDTKRECFKQVTGKEFGGGPPFTCEELEERKKEMTVSISKMDKIDTIELVFMQCFSALLSVLARRKGQ